MSVISDLKSCGSGAVAVPSFWRHVSALHADSDIGFSKEYEEVQRLSQSKECDFPFDHCKHPENKIKNRYLNIVACESNILVHLMSCDCSRQTDTCGVLLFKPITLLDLAPVVQLQKF